MKVDMHCHTREGSLDGQVSVEVFASKLKGLGFGGMLVTDHDSYKGYRAWAERHCHEKDDPHAFHVWKGIEYDTIDAGHMLVIMPRDTELQILELRGLPVKDLIEVVHLNGGILGPAHPCGERFLSFTNTKQRRRLEWLMRQFDFVETWNACEEEDSNAKAKALAYQFARPGTGGSDAHHLKCVGMGWVDIPDDVVTEDDLITYIQNCKEDKATGELYSKTLRSKNVLMGQFLTHAYYFYNHFASWYRFRKRRVEWKAFTEAVDETQ